jgi:hypothetical protein
MGCRSWQRHERRVIVDDTAFIANWGRNLAENIRKGKGKIAYRCLKRQFHEMDILLGLFT